jgi:divalent metal cation (Fe/Co/Zn/Cd) transporter
MTVKRSHLIAHNVKDVLMKEMQEIRDVLVHIEPAVYEPE